MTVPDRDAPKDLATLAPAALLAELMPPPALAEHVRRALAEDLGSAGDVTGRFMVPESAVAVAVLRFRSAGIACGAAAALEAFRQCAPGIRCSVHAADGERLEAGAALLSAEGPLRGILAAERTALNYVGHLSGIATRTAEFVAQAAGTRAAVCDTRKTIPGMRMLEKWAVRCGGGTNHRIGLHDAMLVKDNHVAGMDPLRMADAVAAAVRAARAAVPIRFVEVECDRMDQLDAVLALPAGTVDMVLLDNMLPAQMADAVRRRDARAPHVLLEASGGVRLADVAAIAATGVDRISVGALTHSAPSLDVGLDVEAVR